VVGVLYGDRRLSGAALGTNVITELQARLVELLASGVAAGLARLAQEEQALVARVRFEQFFTPELAEQLTLHPDLLEGRDGVVTVLFCDVRRFSRISESLEPAQTGAWIGDVMGVLSECVRARGGVLVDYYGDGLMSMFGAPQARPDHASLACRAALDILAKLPELNERWGPAIRQKMELGLGIHTGRARLGNTGSRIKFKYGPLGATVNLASRVEGATKYLKCSVLLTGETRAMIDDSFPTRRLCRVRVVGMANPVELYQLAPVDWPLWPEACAAYEKGLAEFEHGSFDAAARTLGDWRARQPTDGPAVVLLHRITQCLVEQPDPFDPVWVLPGK
jgi:adenylate cyclase